MKSFKNNLTTSCQNVNWIYTEKTEKLPQNSGTLTRHLLEVPVYVSKQNILTSVGYILWEKKTKQTDNK